MAGPLSGVRLIELAGLGPAPFAAMVLADLGAEVIRVDRADRVVGGHTSSTEKDLLNRGKRSVGVNLKSPGGVEVVLRLVERSDGLIEGFRPGVTERLGLGPSVCLDRNPGLVYGRMTGWGQDGPYSPMAGHDIDYIALSGALHAVGPADRPVPPLNLVGDYGGGGMLLVVGVLAALTHARSTGEGQVVDAAMVDGSALLMAQHHGFAAEGWWDATRRESNLLDGGAPFYTVYETADGKHMAVGALEPQFFAVLLERLGLNPDDLPAQSDRDGWPRIREVFSKVFLTRTRDEWTEHFADNDACVAPVLTMREAPSHRHNDDRGTFVVVDGVTQPGPAPRFSATRARIAGGPVAPGRDTDGILSDLGFSADEIVMLRAEGEVA